VIDPLHGTMLGGTWGTDGTVNPTIAGVLVSVQMGNKASGFFVKPMTDATTGCALTVRVTATGGSPTFNLRNSMTNRVDITDANGALTFNGGSPSTQLPLPQFTLAYVSNNGTLYAGYEVGTTWTLLPGAVDIGTAPWLSMVNVVMVVQGGTGDTSTFDNFNVTQVSLADLGL
jgi:hypothetical protein